MVTIEDIECFAQCDAEAALSDDKETQVGCVVYHSERGILVKGHNALPNGVRPSPHERLERPGKYAWIEHAERNTIYSAARSGVSLNGCTMYVHLMPCADCARGIIQAGISTLVVSAIKMKAYSNSMYEEQHAIAAVLLEEAGVQVRLA